MPHELLTSFLGWSTLIHLAILLWWLLVLLLAHDWIYHLHSRWFEISPQQFDAIHYRAIAYYKLAVLILNAVPYLVLKLIL